jgi:hypothetical protein
MNVKPTTSTWPTCRPPGGCLRPPLQRLTEEEAIRRDPALKLFDCVGQARRASNGPEIFIGGQQARRGRWTMCCCSAHARPGQRPR